MYAQRVEVLHRHYGEAVVVGVADHFKLNLFPSFQRLLDKYLLGVGESALAVFGKFLVVSAYAGTETAERVA